LAARISPWLKNLQGGTTSAFRTPPRKPLYDGEISEFPEETPDITVVKPRTGVVLDIDRCIDREQRAKVANEGAPFGTYTLQLDYNKSLDNDIPTRTGLKKVDGKVMPASSTIRMEHQTDRPALNAGGNFETTPGLEKLGLSQAVWGTEDGWAGGTEQVLTTKRTHFTKMNHTTWAQHRKTGTQRPVQLMDVMYDADSSVVKKRTQSMVNLKQQTERVPISAAATEGADTTYNWTAFIDKKQVPAPNLKKEPDRAQRMKAGFGSYADPKQDVMYDQKKIQKAISSRVKGVDIESITSRDPPSIVPPDAYKDQLSTGKSHLEIGVLKRSPVFGSPTRVPDMGGKSKRFPNASKKTGKGFHL